MKQIRKPGRVVVLILGLLVFSVTAFTLACGGDDDDNGGATTAPATTQAGNGGNGGNGEEVTFDVSMGDNFFEPKEFTVPAGAEVTFNLTNDGAAIHNMRIAGEDGKYNSADDAVSDPDLVSAGGTAKLEWTAPDKAGEILFQCDFHSTDMVGTITVE